MTDCNFCAETEKLYPLGYQDENGDFMDLGKLFCPKCGSIFEEIHSVNQISTLDLPGDESIEKPVKKPPVKKPDKAKPTPPAKKAPKAGDDGNERLVLTTKSGTIECEIVPRLRGRPKTVITDESFICDPENGCYDLRGQADMQAKVGQSVKKVELSNGDTGFIVFTPSLQQTVDEEEGE